ncbi:4-(cytidine 5'-diphospho)-2-C-methyl-D-erythritol kinase [Acidipropionibacterium jensenii]|uniref:4-diphosphocytidyl-2-C-methyl-D-erythritol kinase n=1 Tax=Acidipropionibacterium jensenii TaxID=1749 RepID=A0A3Q9UKG5_9ACTN|nr:4-(cytidine 5'-diphospho)-2-C-methyl-D-erythritol kinase [Acidipropionibacterium jensenii]AZZ39990.1 4-(cytidine 5'-diphospho)-2-C-methyl-D-erythritol kinase [Acidipropionibacterium jensenii]
MASNARVTPGAPPVMVRVAAKVNLALGVGPLGEDGYHPLTTVFEAVGIYDQISVSARSDDEIHVSVEGPQADLVPADETNLAHRAARLMRERWAGSDLGADIQILKSIPVAGGMAGGSADAAGTLLACSVLWDLDTGPDDLLQLGADLGSDVPFALTGGVALGRGRGDHLVPVISRGTHHWVFATAAEGLSTPQVYRHFDELGGAGGELMSTALIAALTSGDIDAVAHRLGNDLQDAALDLRPELAEVLRAGEEAGALAGLVSGSGPTVAFLVPDEATGRTIATGLAELDQVETTRVARGPVPGAQLLPGTLQARM